MVAIPTDEDIAAGTAPDPFALFDAWFAEASQSEPNDPNAMALATVAADGLPDLRTVLLKGHDRRGFVFYTNLESAKGRQIAAAPKAALLFHWKSARRQVRIRGPVGPVSKEEADAYYHSRPLGSRIGAWASAQSRPLASRGELERMVQRRESEFGEDPPRPPHWSGLRIAPQAMEFWQDGAYRLHDRFRYTPYGEGWQAERLYP